MKKLTPAQLKKMTRLAMQARDHAYCPYSHHPVGVALLSGSGRMYAGANVETAHYKGLCGEASAIAAMVTAGERKIKSVVVIGPAMEYLCTPCGDCRQRLREFTAGDATVYSLWKDGRLGQVLTMEELLPCSFGPDNLAEVGMGPNKNQPVKKKGATKKAPKKRLSRKK
jgi:cytidine deaminase